MLVLAALGAIYQHIGTKIDKRTYPPVGKMVDIGGYKLHMIDSGSGGPTVVIDAGMGCSSLDWALVQPEVAKFARVISYDRAGYAWSDTSPLARTSANIVKELHAMLQNSNIPTPYILVGHSFGGLNVRLYAATYPDEVAGIVLVDASSENGFKFNLTDYVTDILPMMITVYLGINRALIYFKFIDLQKEFANSQLLESLNPSIQKAYCTNMISSTQFSTILKESLAIQESGKQMKQAHGDLGNKPLIIITAGKQWGDDASKKEWADWQVALTKKSSRCKQIIAQNSGHMINTDQPEIIVDAVREMAEEYNLEHQK